MRSLRKSASRNVGARSGGLIKSLAALLGAMACCLSSFASAADYPVRPLRFVVCTPPGGQIDILARLTAEKMQASMGQPAVVENKPGAVGRIAVQDILKTPSDGHSVLFCGIQLVTMPLFFKEPGYGMGKDILTTAILMDNAGTVAINAGIPARNLREFITYAKANPGKLNYVSYGNHHITLAIEAFKAAEGFTMVPIPFAGTAPMLTGMVQGELHFGVNAVTLFKPLVDKNQVRLIATVGSQRTTTAPDVPTAAEQGYPNFIMPSWFAAFVRGGTPKDVTERINRELNTAVRLPDVRTKLEALDAAVLNMNLDEINRDVQSKYEFFSKIATQLKIEKQ